IDDTTVYAAVYTVMATASALVITMAHTGVRRQGCTRLRSRAPGMPTSRAKAYHMRAIDVMEARPQSHIAPPMITATTWPRPRASVPYAMRSTGQGTLVEAGTLAREIAQA